MNKKIRVLHVIAGMGSGGAEAFIMNMFRNIDNKKVVFDFLLRSEENLYKEEIEELGGRIYIMPSYPQNIISNYKETKKFFNQNKEYDIIHVHGNSFIYITAFILAKKNNISCRIMHSHNTSSPRFVYRMVHRFNKIFMNLLVTDRFACSNAAGKWMFGEKKFIKINNGIDIDKFLYNDKIRDKIRKYYNIDKDTILIGHVGRFLKVKNQSYILDIFYEYLKLNKNAKLMLIGEGPKFDEINKKVELLNIKDKVIFLSGIKNVNEMMQAMDIFLFPSLYEGLAVVLVEAQTAGLPCIISDRISKESIISDLIDTKSIDIDPREWAKSIDKKIKNNPRKNMRETIEVNGYSSKNSANILQAFYINHSK